MRVRHSVSSQQTMLPKAVLRSLLLETEIKILKARQAELVTGLKHVQRGLARLLRGW